MDHNAQQQVIARLQQASNVLVTVSNNPSVDQLAACIGFTLLLNNIGKHGTAVFSGKVPSTLEFLKPEDTLEKNTDSLRDFIIALDKSKADKLRYKVEDSMVRIFITPYRTSIDQKDLEFSQGDFNVDAVVAIGVHERTDLDQAIVAHGRILHDATIISVNNKDQGSVGTINWIDLNASSLSEMLVELSRGLGADKFDAQMATAFMTGIVAETERFSNSKTNPRTMTLASELMSAGANQQLIAAKLEESQSVELGKKANVDQAPATADQTNSKEEDGALKITHEEAKSEETDDKLPPVIDSEQLIASAHPDKPDPSDDSTVSSTELTPPAPALSPHPSIITGRSLVDDTPPPPKAVLDSSPDNSTSSMPSRPAMIMQPPSMGGHLTANSQPEKLDPSTDPMSSGDAPTAQEILNRTSSSPDSAAAEEEKEEQEEHVEEAREAVDQAITSEADSQPLKPLESLGAQPVNLPLGNPASSPGSPDVSATGVNPNIPTSLMPSSQPLDSTSSTVVNPGAPPPVPPPMLVPNDPSKPGTL